MSQERAFLVIKCKKNVQVKKKMYLCVMKTNNDMALQMATFLLQVKAIKLNNEHPFTWASGRKSPIYCDNRITLSYPEIRTFIRQRFVDVVNEYWGDVDVVAGVATGGIAQGALVAQELGKPFVYVRSEAKSHGLTNQIEGEIHDVKALRERGCNVKGMAAIFTYGLEVAERNFTEANVELHTLTNYDTLIEAACKEEYIRGTEMESLAAWRKNPEAWSEAHS